MFTIRRQGEIHRPGAAGGNLAERGQLAILLNAPRLHDAFFDFTGGIQRFAIARHGQLRDVWQRAHQGPATQRAGVGIDGKAVQTFAIGIIGTYPGIVGLRGARGGGKQGQ